MFGVKEKCQYKNGSSFGDSTEKIERNFLSNFSQRFLQVNEWTFSLFLFALSLTIVAVKIFVTYGCLLPTKTYDLIKLPSTTEFNGDTLNATRGRYEGTVELFRKFGWLIRAAASGLSLMGFTWFIIYKDSRIPGVNPPSPFSPRKRMYHSDSRIQMNYLIGVVNGILIFIYMCL